jgi:hypothetical protein
MGTAVTLIISLQLSSLAYDVARKYGFELKDTIDTSQLKAKALSSTHESGHGDNTKLTASWPP